MKHTFFLAPVGRGIGLTTVSLGVVRALDRKGVRVGFFKPISQQDPLERSTHFVAAITTLEPSAPIPLAEATRMVAANRLDELLGRIIAAFENSTKDAELVIVEGLSPAPDDTELAFLNRELARSLCAQIILVASAAGKTAEQLDDQIEYAAKNFGGIPSIEGLILNRGPSSRKELSILRTESRLLKKNMPPLAGLIPQNELLTLCRSIDVQRHLEAEIIHAGEMRTRRVKSTSLLARTVTNMLDSFTPGAMLITPSDRSDVIIAVALTVLNRISLAGLILTGDSGIDDRIIRLSRPAFDTGLPLFHVEANIYLTATRLYQLSSEVPVDDLERIREATDHVARAINVGWFTAHTRKKLELRLSPAAFLHQLAEKARAAGKRIILPEGNEPRTIKAASICHDRRIANCLLLGNREEIEAAARGQDIELPSDIEILDPCSVRHRYIEPLVALRKHKALAPEMAKSQLEDNVVLGTVMLALGEVDGLVSGAVHSTANTIRPALQIIKTRPGAKVVSSIFFMCLPEQVLVYGDCAVIPDPDSETLADIAIQSADSASAFGVSPRVAMISYSTGESGTGAGVEKVRKATKLAQSLRPDLLIDGPLQYDAAFMPDVAKTKAPTSPVAGNATVFIFPDLNTGNTTYKAVQRSANVISIGPMLQGLKRPVNDLSRGALVDDIVYTIALTAIQATQT